MSCKKMEKSTSSLNSLANNPLKMMVQGKWKGGENNFHLVSLSPLNHLPPSTNVYLRPRLQIRWIYLFSFFPIRFPIINPYLLISYLYVHLLDFNCLLSFRQRFLLLFVHSDSKNSNSLQGDEKFVQTKWSPHVSLSLPLRIKKKK